MVRSTAPYANANNKIRKGFCRRHYIFFRFYPLSTFIIEDKETMEKNPFLNRLLTRSLTSHFSYRFTLSVEARHLRTCSDCCQFPQILCDSPPVTRDFLPLPTSASQSSVTAIKACGWHNQSGRCHGPRPDVQMSLTETA